jgi:SAM-dependent methyltransferase
VQSGSYRTGAEIQAPPGQTAGQSIGDPTGSERLDPLLSCPDCGGELAAQGAGLRCGVCRRGFSREGGIPRLLPAAAASEADARTVAAFDRQWRSYGRLRRLFGKDPAAMTANLVGARMGSRIDAAWYRGRTVLDAGCGHGRYLPAFAALGARPVGLDAGCGPETTGVLREDPRIAVVQGDVRRPPFRPGSFDLVFCDGVIHHTSDPRGAYLALARLVKPGGALYVWVYPKEGALREAGFRAARAVSTRLPGPAVRTLAFALAPLTSVVRSYSGTRFGRATWAECAQVVHDWIAPPLQSHHDVEELEGWARDAGLASPERLPVPTGLIAWRPPR